MSGTLKKVLNIFLYLLLGISLLVTVLFFVKNAGVDPDLPFQEQMQLLGSSLDNFMYWAYVLLGIAGVSAVVFGLLSTFTSPKNAIKAVVVIAIFAAIVGIAYSTASDAPMTLPGAGIEDNVTTLKWSGAGLFVAYFLFAGAIVSILFTEIVQIFK